MSLPFAASSRCKCRLRTVKLPDSVFCRNTLAAIGSMPGLAFPAMIEIDAVGAIAILLEKRSIDAVFRRVRAGAALLGEHPRRRVGLPADVLEHPPVPHLGDHALERHVLALQEGVEAHHAEPHRRSRIAE